MSSVSNSYGLLVKTTNNRDFGKQTMNIDALGQCAYASYLMTEKFILSLKSDKKPQTLSRCSYPTKIGLNFTSTKCPVKWCISSSSCSIFLFHFQKATSTSNAQQLNGILSERISGLTFSHLNCTTRRK